MENSKNVEIKVGALVAVGVVLFVLAVILLGSDTNFLKSTYSLRVDFSQVQGLGPGSVVQFLGVPIGNVKKIVLVSHEGQNHLVAILNLDRHYESHITEGSVAGVRTQGALGDKFIFITGGPADAPPLRPGAFIPTEKRGDFFDTLAASSDKVDKIFAAVDEAHRLLANLNANGESAKLMEGLVDTTEELKKTLHDVRGEERGVSKLHDGLVHLDNILAKIDSGQGTLGALINDRSVFDNVKRMLGGSAKEKYIKSLVRETIQSSEGK